MSLGVASLRALAHPVRLRILSLLTGTAMSAAEIARELDISQANASYHLRVRASTGQVVHVGDERVRGGLAKKYRHPWQDGPKTRPKPGRPPDEHRVFVEAVAQELVRRSAQRASGGAGLTTDAEMWLPPGVWSRAHELVAQASALVHAHAQPPRSPGTVHVNMTAVLFELGASEGDGE